eukprot:GHVS01007712.1.p1 GENE.GHVS01007712.1~~GHVS01007712.1.p1  ORF type:complete len:502 (+),score=123.76 GHVS01007712.1:115-1506(+)
MPSTKETAPVRPSTGRTGVGSSSSGSGGNLSYLHSKSSFIADLRFDISSSASFPLPLEPKFLSFPLPRASFCRYTPTTVHLEKHARRSLPLITEKRSGFFVDINDPTPNRRTDGGTQEMEEAVLEEEDADLLSGIIHGYENVGAARKRAEKRTRREEKIKRREAKRKRREEASAARRRRVEREKKGKDAVGGGGEVAIIGTGGGDADNNSNMGDSESDDEKTRLSLQSERLAKDKKLVGVLRHPMKKHLVAKKVYRVLPHPRLWNNQYIHTALDIEPTPEAFRSLATPAGGPPAVVPEIVLKLKTVKALRKDFSLFHRPEVKKGRREGETVNGDEEKNEIEYSLAREYIWKAPAVGQTSAEQHFLLRLPAATPTDTTSTTDLPLAITEGPTVDTTEPADAVYLVPLRGPRLILQKAGAVTGAAGSGFASAGGLAGLQALMGGTPAEDRGEGPNDAIFSASIVD